MVAASAAPGFKMESAPTARESAALAGLIWVHRADDLFIQIPPAPKERVLEVVDRSVFRRFMAFAIVGIVVGFGYSEGMPLIEALAGLMLSVILGLWLWSAYRRRRAL